MLVLALAAAIVFVPGASAGSIADFDPCPRGSNDDLVCPVGQVGVNYSIKFHGDEAADLSVLATTSGMQRMAPCPPA